MRRFFERLGYRYSQWMQGRYGVDELSRFLTWTGVALIVASLFRRTSFLALPAWILMVWSLFRTYSKNCDKRLAERNRYLAVKGKLEGFADLQKRKWSDRKTHRYFKCAGCGKVLRVPKGKGTIKIICPQCGKEIIKKT